MKIIVPEQIREILAPQLPAGVEAVWVNVDGDFDGVPTGATAYFRWWTGRPILEKVLAAAPTIRWLHTPSAGVDHLLTPTVLERDITLTNSAGVHAIPIAEFVLAALLSHLKRLPAYAAAQAARRWDRETAPEELFERTVLILGAGGIGQAIAERAAAFGVRVWGTRRTARPTPGVERVVPMDEWRTLLPEVDALVVAAPLTDETRGMVDAAALAALKPGAYLINIARGQIVVESALVDALQSGRLAGAALDTFDEEPLPADSPLWALPGVTITPHATASSPRMRERQIALFIDNLRRLQAGEPLRNVVDKAAGY